MTSTSSIDGSHLEACTKAGLACPSDCTHTHMYTYTDKLAGTYAGYIMVSINAKPSTCISNAVLSAYADKSCEKRAAGNESHSNTNSRIEAYPPLT